MSHSRKAKEKRVGYVCNSEGQLLSDFGTILALKVGDLVKLYYGSLAVGYGWAMVVL